MKRRQKTGFLSLTEKERRKRKIEEKEIRRRKKSDGCTRSFYNKTEKKLLDAKGSFDDNVIKNPARNKNIKGS